MSTKLWRATLVLTDQLLEDGAVVFEGENILWVGPAADLPGEYSDVEDQTPAGTTYVTPGFIDVHCHGGGGCSFPDATEVAQVETAAAEHLKHGTTTMVASLVTAAQDMLVERARTLAQAAQNGTIRGIHFEGPFLSEARCGAQDPRFLTDPTPAAMAELMEAAGGYALSMTIAPERTMSPVGVEALGVLTQAGAIPSWGHTDGGIEVTDEAIAEGVAQLSQRRASVTHLFNGMRPLHHRDPGPISSYLRAAADGEVVVEMICDGVHLDPELVGNIMETVGRDNCVFVTDAMAAAGMADGEYVLGPQKVRVENGVARLAHSDSLAGGTSHILDCVRVAVTRGRIDLVDAVFLGTAQGARLFGWNDRGELEVGRRSDLCALTEDLALVAVARGGELI
ncbi:amidohydrolase family protein [Actinomyces sp. F1_1611]